MDMAKLNNRAEITTLAPASQNNSAPTVGHSPVSAEKNHNDQHNSADDREQLLTAVADMQEYAQSAQRNLQFSLDDKSQRMVVTVTEASTGKVIRQMPSEEALRLSENLEEIRSVLFSGKV